jgi:hypothetical protein
MAYVNENECQGIADYDDFYNPTYGWWNPRGVTGFESNARMKAVFEDLEYWIEDVIGA